LHKKICRLAIFATVVGIGYVDKITKVEISPDDPSTVITISGLTRRGLVYAGTVVVASGIGEFNIPFKYYDFCQLCKCPMLSGTNFVFTLSQILIPKAFAVTILSFLPFS
jgi:hypothetical protein